MSATARVLDDVLDERHRQEAIGREKRTLAPTGQRANGGGFIRYEPKPGSHTGQHPNCLVCAPLRPPDPKAVTT